MALSCTVALALLPIAAIVLGRWSRSLHPGRRVLAKVGAVLVLWITFDLSLLALWGAIARNLGAPMLHVLVMALLVGQPGALAIAVLAVRRGARDERGDRATLRP